MDLDAIAILEILVLNGSELVRKAIAKSGPLAFAPELLEVLASDPRPSVRASSASNYRIAFHDDLIDKLSNDVPQVRETLESNDMIKSLLSSYT